MDNTGTPNLPDWLVLTARWSFLIALCFWMVFRGGVDWLVLVIVIFVCLENILATSIFLAARVSSAFRQITTISDFVIAQLLFFLSVGTGYELTWLGFLPLISATFYFQWLGAIIAILVNTILQGVMAYIYMPLGEALLLVGVILPLYILVGFVLAFVRVRMKSELMRPRKLIVAQPGLAETKVQEHRQTFYNLITELSSTLDYQKVVETSLDLGTIALSELGAKVDRLVSAVMLFSTKDSSMPELDIATSRRLLTYDRNITLPGVEGALAVVIDEGITVFVEEPKTDPELNKLIALHECRSAYLLPLRSGLDAYGVLLFAHPDPDFFTTDKKEVLEIVRNQSTIAIQNARLYQALELEKNRMMEIQEESRKKLARDLHDGPTQSISAIAMRIDFARRLMEDDLSSASEELYKIEELARKTTKEMRHMLFTLRPLVLESQGLVAALESMADRMREIYNQEVILQIDPRVVDQLEVTKQGVIFYIIEEAVNNARKHAQADQIWVRLKMIRDSMGMLEIEDDGVGFDTSELDSSYESRSSLGMINMKERTELVNGILRIESTIGKGTFVRAAIPLNNEAIERLRQGG
jgi:signal transduction histidine kinase